MILTHSQVDTSALLCRQESTQISTRKCQPGEKKTPQDSVNQCNQKNPSAIHNKKSLAKKKTFYKHSTYYAEARPFHNLAEFTVCHKIKKAV